MSQIELIDFHLHTRYSGHGEGSVDDIAAVAQAKGLAAISFTEHYILPDGIDDEHGFSMSLDTARAYRDEVLAARERYPGLDIVYGTEVDWLGSRAWPGGVGIIPSDNDDKTGYLSAVAGEYEYILGSVHFVDGWAFDNPEYLDEWDRRDVDAVWLRYFELFCELAASDVGICCLSHPDIVKKFGHRPSFDTRELFEHVAKTVAAHGKMVEVNTAGARKPVGELYPGHQLLSAFCDAGVDCTVGSDAHCAAEVGLGISDAYGLMASVGYSHVAVPCAGGDRRYLSLEGVA